MLNYIWVGLILVAVLVATGTDIHDEWANTYRNGVPLDGVAAIEPPSPSGTAEASIDVTPEQWSAWSGASGSPTALALTLDAPRGATPARAGSLIVGENAPAFVKKLARASGSPDRLAVTVSLSAAQSSGVSIPVRVQFEPVHFAKMKAITAAAFEAAAAAVTIALGLIGVMTLWLGVLKIGETAGLLQTLTRLLAPITRRLFPDVPADHPAIGAIIMNTAANMLGLSNAATPMGLKAMEELNKLNAKVGTATNAMVTFLAINTGGLILIPATAMAVRAAVGSANPGIIIGTSIVGAGCATVAGVIASRLLQHLPRYRNEGEKRHD
jgi:spore maturation protein A